MQILFDIGGTSMRVAAAVDGQLIPQPIVLPTPKNYIEGIRQLVDAAKQLAAGEMITAVAGGIAGPFDKEKTHLVRSPNLPLWVDQPVKVELESQFKTPVFLENDAALAAIGEAVYGAGKSYSIVGYLSFGTGVGGAKVIDGKLDPNASGFEPGHQIINFDKDITFEQMASGSGLMARFGKNSWEITDINVWDEVSRAIAYGLNNIIVTWSPEVIVIGGGLINSDRIDLGRTQIELRKICKIFPKLPPLIKAEKRNYSGLYGALELLK